MRNLPATSSMTGSGTLHSAAMYSVCPVKGMPASLITLLCTGAVTMAENSRRWQPSTARSMSRSAAGALRMSTWPGTAGPGQRLVQHREFAGRARRRDAAAA